MSFSAAVITHDAKASPPEEGTKAYEELAPYGADIKGMKLPGHSTGCCDLSDCRSVKAYVNRNGHYMVLIPRADKETGQGFDGGDDKYHEVPEAAVVPEDRRPRIPFDLACWAAPSLFDKGGFYCFTPKLMT
jgi:hypothetical protein